MRVMGLLMVGLAVPSPIAWAQMDPAILERDPILALTIEAAVKADPDLQKDLELRGMVEQLAKDCLTDPRARAEITYEVGQVRAEGGAEKVISKDVLTAVRSETSTTFASREADMRKALEAMPANSTERKMAELNMEHGRAVMEAYAKGEASPPPPREMVAHAQEMFKEWSEKSGASPREIEMAKFSMERFASGEMAMGGGGFGPGHGGELGGPAGGMPSAEQMQQMVASGQMTSEQMKMAQEYMAHGPEAFGPGPVEMGGFGGSAPIEQAQFDKWVAEGNVSPEHQAAAQKEFEVYREKIESQVYDTNQTKTYDTNNPPPGGGSPTPEGPHTKVSEVGGLGQWDGADADTLPDHTHPIGAAPHSGP